MKARRDSDRRKPNAIATFSTIDPTWTVLGSVPGLHSEGTAINC